MRILKASIIPTLSLVSLAMAVSAHAAPPVDTAAQQHSGSGNFVFNISTIGSASGTTVYGLRFSGTNGAVSNNNIVKNYGTIISGTGSAYFPGAGITFDASSGGQSSGNTVYNYGVVTGVTSNGNYSSGILFNAYDGGSANLNRVINSGAIQAVGDGLATGLVFIADSHGSFANFNTILNTGIIAATSYNNEATGFAFYADGGSASGNTISNSSLIQVVGGYATGIYFEGGVTDGNRIDNRGVITVSGQGVYGISFSGDGNPTDSSSRNVINNYGLLNVTGEGVAYGIVFDDGSISNGNVINNFGVMNVRGDYARGFYFDTDGGSANHNIITNRGSIAVLGTGTSGYATGFLFESHDGPILGNVIDNHGTIRVSSPGDAQGFHFESQGSPTAGNIINNYGKLIVTGSQAAGVFFDGSDGGATGNTINNRGLILASGSMSGGVVLVDADSNVVNNWGTITSTGKDFDSGAIVIYGNHNVVNLNGHSTTNGLISAEGENNILNLNFTGVSPKAERKLRAQLMAQNALGGGASEGWFTLRGVTYTYDPLIVNLNVSSYEKQGKTPNQKAIGANLDSFKVNPTGDMLGLLNAIDASGNVPAALEQLSPQRYQIYGDIALANANFLTQGIDQRLDNLRVGSEAFDTSALGVSSSSIQGKLGLGATSQTVGAASMSKDGKGVTLKEVVPTECKPFSAFLSGQFTYAERNGQEWQQDSNFSSSGLLAGFDAKITDNFTGGLLLSYAHADADLDSRNSTANVDTYAVGAYSGFRQGNYYANSLFAYARNVYESDREIDIPGFDRTANGRTSGNQFVLNLDGGYDQPVNENLTVGPFAGLQYVHLGVNGFTENGAGAAGLEINDQMLDSLRSRLGARLELRKEVTPCWMVASEARLAWQHEFANNDRAIVSRFTNSGLGAFSVRTDDPERDALVAGLGVNATYRQSVTVFADYDVQVDSRYTEQIVKGGLRWNF